MVKYCSQYPNEDTVTNEETDCEEIDRVIHKKKLQKQKSIKYPREAKKFSKEDELENYLTCNEETITSEEYFKQVHEFFKNQNKKNPQTNYRMKEYLYEKVCEVCNDIRNDHLMLLCDYCDDAYHTYCLQPKLESVPEEDVWICPLCYVEKNRKEIEEKHQKLNKSASSSGRSSKKNQRQTLLEEHYEIVKPEKECVKQCNKCQKTINNASEKEYCTRCQNHFHRNCFSKKKNAILCKECVTFIKSSIPPKNESILKYFQSKNPEKSSGLAVKQEAKSRSKSRKKNTFSCKKKKTFKLPKYSKDPSIEIELKHNLLFALKAKEIEFDDDLRYSNPLCGPEKNQGNLESSLQKMDKETLNVFHEFKRMSKIGNYVPVHIEPDKIQGFIVRAAEDIAEMTLICEYVGDVDYARNRIFDQNDSIMDLLRTTRSKTSLVICPEKYGNLARFLSGINNSEKGAKKKQNVQSVRFNVEGQARVILYAKRCIKKGELLCYDYNEGCFDGYPTENFV